MIPRCQLGACAAPATYTVSAEDVRVAVCAADVGLAMRALIGAGHLDVRLGNLPDPPVRFVPQCEWIGRGDGRRLKRCPRSGTITVNWESTTIRLCPEHERASREAMGL